MSNSFLAVGLAFIFVIGVANAAPQPKKSHVIEGHSKTSGPYSYTWVIDPNAATQTLNGQDGDVIELSRSENPSPIEGYITIRLRQPSTWWKAITVHDGDTFLYEANYVQDNVVDNTKNVDHEDFSKYTIVLSKAKFLGFHVNVYWIQNAADMDPNYIWDFNWIKD